VLCNGQEWVGMEVADPSFEVPPTSGTRRDVIEQIVRFTLSSDYAAAKEQMRRLFGPYSRSPRAIANALIAKPSALRGRCKKSRVPRTKSPISMKLSIIDSGS
jgi:hypothetical protein